MNRGVYSTATGMAALQRRQELVANNLANLNTVGFKRDAVAFAETYLQALAADGGRGAPIGSIGSGPVEVARTTVFKVGSIEPTGNPLDVAIDQDRGLFAVMTPAGVRYTRDGSFSVDSSGQLVSRGGHPVLDDRSQPISLPAKGEVEVAEDGSVSVDGTFAGQIALWDGRFSKQGDNLFAGVAQPIEDARMSPGHLENSNVNAIESMLQMIEVNRAYEMSQRAMTSQDELTQRLIQSMTGS